MGTRVSIGFALVTDWGRAALVLLLAAPTPALALDWSLGTHLGLSSITSGRTSGSTTLFAGPATVLGYQPGLRLGCANGRRSRELFIDAGWLYIDEAGSPYHQTLGSLGFQQAFSAQQATSPFVDLDVGFYDEGGPAASAVAGQFGGGVGVRHTVSERHGDVRGEARIDRLLGVPSLGRPDLIIWSLRLGFDLWL